MWLGKLIRRCVMNKDFEKEELVKLINTRDSFEGVEDCYCALMKQIFLSKSTLN